MVSARTTAPRTPRIFISTVLPISSRFSGTIAERRSGDGAYANVKFPCEGFPIESLRAFRQMLKCFLQKAEHASEEQERHQPAALQAAAANDVFERHINDGNGNERFNHRRKPEEIRRKIIGGSNQRNRMRDGERGDDGDERAETAKRDYKTKQKQKMVGAVENVEKTQVDKSQSGLVPARVETDETGIAGEFECTHFSAGRQKPKDGYDAQTQPRERRMNGKTGLLRLNWVFEQHV